MIIFLKYNHNIIVRNIDLRDNIAWPKVYNLECKICNIEIELIISNFEFIKDLIEHAPIISINRKIYFIMRESNDLCPHYSEYTKEKDILTCNEFLIKKLLE